MILALQTTTFGAHGGIPTFNRCVCRVLNDFEVRPARVLIANDSPVDVVHGALQLPRLRLEGFAGKRPRFAGKALMLASLERADLALLGHVNYAPLGLALKRLRPRLRYGVMVHGVEAWSRLPLLKRTALRAADFIIAVSDYTKNKLIHTNGISLERVYVLSNTLEWADATHSQPQSIESLPGEIKLLSVCRLEEAEGYKGVDTVIRALPSVIDQVKDVHYFVIGGGSDLARHKELAHRAGVSSRVHFAGSVDQSTLQAYYRACDLFVMPSAGEGFGIVFLEAMHYGKAIIAASSGAAPEVVRHDESGLLVEYGNVPQLAEAIVRLCRESELRLKLGREGFARLQERFCFARFRERLNTILLRELAADSERAPLQQRNSTGTEEPETFLR